MTNISKQPLPPKEEQKLFAQFSKTIARLNSQNSDGFITDLLGPEEQIMLTKRLAAIVMYAEGYSCYRVWNTLHISPSTAHKIAEQFEANKYTHIQKLFIKHKTDYKKLLSVIDFIARGGLPPMAGPGRWGDLASVRGTRSKK